MTISFVMVMVQEQQIQPAELLELLHTANVEEPYNPEIYELAFERLDQANQSLDRETAQIDGNIALMGLRWKGFQPAEFNFLSSQSARLEFVPDKTEKAILARSHTFLSAVGKIIPIIGSLAATHSKISPWDMLHASIKQIERSGIGEDAQPLTFISLVRK